MVLINGLFLGSDEDLLALIKTKYTFVEPSLSSLHDLAYKDYTEFLNSNPRVCLISLPNSEESV